MHARLFCFGLAILLPVTLTAPGSATEAGATPGAFVTALAQQALAAANDRTLSAADRGRRMDTLLDTGFDMPRIASYVVGPYWRAASAADRQAFTTAFRDNVGRAYFERFSDYDAGTFQVVGQRNGTSAGTVVSTEIDRTEAAIREEQTAAGRTVRLDWLVAARDGYRIVDVTVGGVSMAATRRAEFTAYLRSNGGGLTGLTQRLQATTAPR